jgi:hypothetical protein
MIEFVRSQISFRVDKIIVFYPATNRGFSSIMQDLLNGQ